MRFPLIFLSLSNVPVAVATMGLRRYDIFRALAENAVGEMLKVLKEEGEQPSEVPMQLGQKDCPWAEDWWNEEKPDQEDNQNQSKKTD